MHLFYNIYIVFILFFPQGYLNLVYTTVGSNWLEFIRNLPEMKEWKINNFLDKYTDKNECFKHCLLEWGNKYPHKDRIKVVLQNTGMKCGIVIDLDN